MTVGVSAAGSRDPWLDQDLARQLTEWRRDFHAHPELGFEERRTARIVADHLKTVGFEVRVGIGGTGVIGVLPFPEPSAGAVLARFDMDALPIQEATGLPFASKTPGVMHACGHDGHVAIGMAVAAILARRRRELARHVTLLFQPAEEGLGGAQAVLAQGAIEDPPVDVCVSLHLWNRFRVGAVAVPDGPAFAASDRFTCEIKGRGGHAALPVEHQDVVLAAAATVTALHTAVSRDVAPGEPAVLSVASFTAGEGHNVMPDRAVLKGTIRSYSEDVRLALGRRVREIPLGVAQAYGCSADVTVDRISPVVDNHPAVATQVRAAISSAIGRGVLIDGARLMVSEDVGHLFAQRPGCDFLVGAAPEGGRGIGGHHTSTFDIDERALSVAARAMSEAVIVLSRSTTLPLPAQPPT